MEHFYQLLKEYNIGLKKRESDLPEWFFQYTEDVPPLYWKAVYEILKDEDKNFSIAEIGAGYGDITALLYFMGFRKIVSFESKNHLCKRIDDKIFELFRLKANTINKTYPYKLDYQPDILIQVNCVYSENVKNKEDYLKQIRMNYQINGIPKIFIYEAIDDSYQEENEIFPKFLRLNKADLKQLFPRCQIQSFATYRFPKNKVSKTLYKLCR